MNLIPLRHCVSLPKENNGDGLAVATIPAKIKSIPNWKT